MSDETKPAAAEHQTDQKGCDVHFFEQILNFNLARCRRCEKVIYRELPGMGVRKFV